MNNLKRGVITNTTLAQLPGRFYLSGLVQVQNRMITWVISHPKDHWTLNKIRDSKGKERMCWVPSGILKKIQKRLLNIFYQIYKPSSAAHGFVPHKSIVTNATPHIKCDQLLKIDIKNFFPSITTRQVFAFFKYKLKCNKVVARTLTILTTYKGHLPQGSVTSPYLSNCILDRLDYRLGMLAQKLQCQYTRYADDIAISTKDNDNLGSLYKLKQLIVKILGEEGFQENTKKTEFKRHNQRKTVTGIVVNEKLNPKRWYYLRTRAAAHQYSTQDKKEQRSTRGKILYVGNINSRKGELLIQMIEKGYEQADQAIPESEQGWITSRKEAWVSAEVTV